MTVSINEAKGTRELAYETGPHTHGDPTPDVPLYPLDRGKTIESNAGVAICLQQRKVADPQ